MARVQLYCGPARSLRARKLDGIVREQGAKARLLVPTAGYARRRTEALLLEGDSPGTWGRPVTTFERFAETLLRDAGLDVVCVDELERRLLLQQAVGRLLASGALDAIGPAAETEGFLNHVARIIVQLKQAAIEPEAFRERVTRRRNPSVLDPVVGAVYAEYQQALVDNNLYDSIGIYWRAEQVVSGDRLPGTLAETETLILDGFDDFTPSEFRLLGALAPHVEQLIFGLNLDDTPGRGDLYAVQLRTQERIQTEWDVQQRVFEGAPPASFAEYAADFFQWRDALPPTAGLAVNLTAFPCPGPTAEAEAIGRRIKSLLIEGVCPSDIAVVYRDLSGTAELIRAVFEEFQIPVCIDHRPGLTDSAVCSFILDTIDSTQAWLHGDILDILTSPWFGAQRAESFPVLARLAGIVSGPQEWEKRAADLIERLAQDKESHTSRFAQRIPNALEAAQSLLAAVQRLRAHTEGLARSRPPAAHASGVEDLIEGLGLTGTVSAFPDPSVRTREESAFMALCELLGRYAVWHEKDGKPITRAEFASQLREMASITAFRDAGPSQGVQCLSAEKIRHLHFDYVFFGGVNEGIVPRRPPASAIYSERDLRDLERVKLALEGRRERSDRELLYFHHVLEAPRKELCVTWRTLSADGKPLLPSPFLGDLLSLFEEDAVCRPGQRASEYCPGPEEIASVRDLRNTAMATHPGLAEIFPEEIAPVRDGFLIEQRRQSPKPFDVFDGVLSDESLRSAIEESYGPDHVFSANQLEGYTKCPFRFFAERILRLEAVETPEVEFDRRDYGIIVHRVLEGFHRHFKGVAMPDIPEEEGLALLAELVEEEAGSRAWMNSSVPPGAQEVEKRRLHALFRRYLLIERPGKGEDAWHPQHFEISFGAKHADTKGGEPSEPPLVLATPVGDIRVEGRIDRVDEGAEGYRVVDYKSGGAPGAGTILDGLSLQFALYAFAVEDHIFPGSTCAVARFLTVGRKGGTICPNRGKLKWEAVKAAAGEAIAQAVTGIRAAEFPPLPAEGVCSHCPVKRACRIDASRVERKPGA